MIRLLAAIAALLAIIAASTAYADPADIAATSRSVVRVVLIGEEEGELGLVGHGSGVAVAPDTILTNAHVIEAAEEDDRIRIGIVPSQGKGGWFARVLAVSRGNDLALLKLTEPGSLPVATLFTGAVTDGEDVFAVGYPGGVDLAQGFSMNDMVTPATPVKTRGTVSAGRSSKQFDTILHTAPIGAGNSGGPLLDTCGRVIGVNSFGTLSDGSDSEFFFAVSMREIARFLLRSQVKAPTTGAPCRSIADADRAEAERLAGQREQSAAAERTAAAAQAKAERQAQLEVIGERENGMALAGIALMLALVAGGSAFMLAQKERKRETWIAAALGALLTIGAAVAWMARPSLTEIDSRAAELVAKGDAKAAAPTAASGELVCVLDTSRSRVTVSDTSDVPLTWSESGCVNQRSQYGLGTDGWSRVLVPNGEDTVTVASFDPATGAYRTDRYLLGIDDMARLRAQREKLVAPACGAGEKAARKLGADQAALTALLPATPNERLVYNCQTAR